LSWEWCSRLAGLAFWDTGSSFSLAIDRHAGATDRRARNHNT
jgi:hypothetical protein